MPAMAPLSAKFRNSKVSEEKNRRDLGEKGDSERRREKAARGRNWARVLGVRLGVDMEGREEEGDPCGGGGARALLCFSTVEGNEDVSGAGTVGWVVLSWGGRWACVACLPQRVEFLFFFCRVEFGFEI